MERLRRLLEQAREFIGSQFVPDERVADEPRADLQALFRTFLKVGSTGFGGGIAVIAQIRRLVVRDKRWLTENEFLDAVSLAQSLPGANAVNAITYIGLKTAGLRGALVAASSFILPSFVIMIALTVAHNYLHNLPDAQRVFQGFNAAVVGLIAATVVRLGKTAMQNQWHLEMGVATGFMLIFTNTSIAEVVLMAGIAGIFIHSFKNRMRQRVRQKVRKQRQGTARAAVAETQARQQAAELIDNPDELAGEYQVKASLPSDNAEAKESVTPKPASEEESVNGGPAPSVPARGNSGRLSAFAWPLLWLAAIPFLSKLLAVWQLVTIFLRIGSVTFGGGFVMIPQIEADVVDVQRWLTHQEFADGMAFGQITPGPVMITATFIGFKVAGIVGAVAATIAAFLPSFAMTVIAGTSLNRFRSNYLVQAFLSGISPAVVGMLAAAGVSLARSALSTTLSFGNIPVSFGLATLAFLLMLRARLNPVVIIFGSGAAQLVISRYLLAG